MIFAIFYASYKVINAKYFIENNETGYKDGFLVDVFFIDEKNIKPYNCTKIIKTKKYFLEYCNKYDIDLSELNQDKIKELK